MKKALTFFCLSFAVVALYAWVPTAGATSTLYANNCASCHGTTPTTCAGCHAHGVHATSSKTGINLTGTTNKTSYTPGETVSVVINGGYRSGWVRAILYDQNMVEKSRSTGASGEGGGASFPVTLTAPAPTAAGTYTWKISWYGNKYDTGSATFGSSWTPDPNNPNHGQEIVSINSFTVASAADTTIPVVSAFTLPATATSLTIPVTTFTATDNVGVTGYLITTSATAPTSGWLASAPTSVTAITGSNTFYAWARDAAGNISASASATVTVTAVPPSKIGIYDPAVSQWFIDYNGNGVWNGTPTDRAYWHGFTGTIPVTGDWNGDGITDIGVYSPATAQWYLDYNGNGVWDGTPTDKICWHGFSGAIPVTGDWNGDGITDIGIYDPASVKWYLDYNGNGVWDGETSDRLNLHGFAGVIPVTGDWNGDGITDIGVYDPANAQWYLDYNGNGVWNGTPTDKIYWHGFTGVIPVTGDWNGDGITEIGTYDPATAQWYVDYNGNGAWDGTTTDRIYWNGFTGVIPITGKW